MTVPQTIRALIKDFQNGKYDVSTFCDLFTTSYYFEQSGYLHFHGEERKSLDELAKVVEMFSPNEEDLRAYPDFYTTEQQVKAKVAEVIGNLKTDV